MTGKSTTTKRRTANVATNIKGKKSADSASIFASVADNRGNAATGLDGASSSDRTALLASEGGVELLETGGSDSAKSGVLVLDKQPELKSPKHSFSASVFGQCKCKDCVSKSASECVFENEPGVKLSPGFQQKYASNFKRSPKVEEGGQLNLLEAEEDGGEAPDPDDFDNLEAFKAAWDSWATAQFDEVEEEISQITAEEIWNQSSNCDGSTYAVELVPVSPLPELNSGSDRPISSVNATSIAETSSANDILGDISTETCGTSLNVEPTSSRQALPANPFQLTETASELQTSEIVSPESSKLSQQYNQSLLSLKMSADFYLAHIDQVWGAEPISGTLTGCWTKSGITWNGTHLAACTLEAPGVEKDCLLLRSPGALSSTGNGRPPGTCKLDQQLKELKLIAPGEVAAPEFLEAGYQLPTGFSNPSEMRTALELAQVQAQQFSIAHSSELPAKTELTAIVEAHSATPWTGEPPLLDSNELSTLPNWGSLNKEELLNYAIASHQIVARIERKEFDLAMMKLQQVNLAGLCLKEFKRRCGHGEFESSLEAVGIKPRTAQNYMTVSKNWDLIESKAHSVALLKEGETLGLNWALETVRESKRSLKSAAAPSDPDCWRTPDTIEQPILQLVKTALGGTITLDPAADDAKSVPALNHYTKADDGLNQDWEGYVFLNPPFSDPLPWVKKLCFMRGRGDVKGAIALLKAGCINNQGTGELIAKYASAVCNWRGRIAFLNEEGEAVKGSDFDCVFVYFGLKAEKFVEVFSPWGTVSWLNHSVANCQLPATANNQQLTTFTNTKQEETAAAASLGLSNGKSILPDKRDSDRAASEAHDPNTVTSLIDSNWCKQTAVGVISNAEIFEADQATTITHSLLNTDFQAKTKLLVQRLTDDEIKELMAICDDELDKRCEK